MPPAFYTAPEFCEFEKGTLFREQWICLGRVDQIPERGDYFTVDLVGEPLIVVRGQDEQIRILANVCRHRGSLIAERRRKGKKFCLSLPRLDLRHRRPSDKSAAYSRAA